MDVIDDLLLPLRTVAALGADLAAYAERAVVGVEHARITGDVVEVPPGTDADMASAFDTACRIARWLPDMPVPERPEGDEGSPDDGEAHRRNVAVVAGVLETAAAIRLWHPSPGLLDDLAGMLRDGA